MAGIGFELRKLLSKDNYLGTIQAYGYAGLISSGPWVLSIIGILVLGLVSEKYVHPAIQVKQFQLTITYLMALSLILSGLFQHGFTRFIADKIYMEEANDVVPNFNGALTILIILSGLIGFVLVTTLFGQQSEAYKLLTIGCFVVLNAIWLAVNLLSGLKLYKVILLIFGIAYFIILAGGYYLSTYGLDGMLLGFFIGQLTLLFGLLIIIYRHYSSSQFLSFEFMKPGKMYVSLIFTGVLYNVGIWADKFIFWFHPSTGESVLGPLHASIIYDLPIFIAYLSIIPGMAVFLLRLETDFVECHMNFYNAIRDSKALNEIREYRNQMVASARKGIFDIIKIQGLTVFIVFALAPQLLSLFGISTLHLPLLYIDVISAGLQVIFLGLLNIFFYLDKRKRVVVLSIIFVLLNISFTYLSIHLGPFYYGYGYALALLITVAINMWCLDRDFESLEFATYALQT